MCLSHRSILPSWDVVSSSYLEKKKKTLWGFRNLTLPSHEEYISFPVGCYGLRLSKCLLNGVKYLHAVCQEITTSTSLWAVNDLWFLSFLPIRRSQIPSECLNPGVNLRWAGIDSCLALSTTQCPSGWCVLPLPPPVSQKPWQLWPPTQARYSLTTSDSSSPQICHFPIASFPSIQHTFLYFLFLIFLLSEFSISSILTSHISQSSWKWHSKSAAYTVKTATDFIFPSSKMHIR